MFLKTLGPNGMRITVVSWKAGSRKGRSPYFGGLGFWRLLGRKGRPKGAFLKTIKIENGTKKQLFRKVRRWDPLKTVPGSCFEKTWKIYEKKIGKSMVFDGPKPLESIEKQTLFLILGHSKKHEKTIPKGTSKVMFFGSKWRHGPPRFDLSFVFWRFAAMPKNHHFWTPSRWTKKSKNRALERQGLNKKCQGRRQVVHFWPGWSQGPPRARGPVKKKTTEEQKSSWCKIWHAMGRWPG